MPRKPRALGYVRVSTEEQAQHGSGLAIQRKAIREFCRARGLVLVEILADEGVSGSNGLDSRLGLADALGRIRRGDATVLVVYRFDRLARKLQMQLTITEALEAAGAQVLSVSEPDVDGPDELRDLIRNVLGSVSEYERAVIRGRMLAGRRAKAARGGFIGGTPRLGYAAVNGALVPDAQEQAVVARIKALAANGASLREIAAQLEAEGFRTKRGGDRWHANQVRRVLMRAD